MADGADRRVTSPGSVPGRRLVVEADGGSRGNPGPAGYGALVRDASTGRVLAERAASLGIATNNVAEYSGLVAGLAAAIEVDSGADVEVRMDSKLVVEQMSGRWKVKHEDMRRLALQAAALASQLFGAGGSVTYRWVPRAQNSAADALANRAMDGEDVLTGADGEDVLTGADGEGVRTADGEGVRTADGEGVRTADGEGVLTADGSPSAASAQAATPAPVSPGDLPPEPTDLDPRTGARPKAGAPTSARPAGGPDAQAADIAADGPGSARQAWRPADLSEPARVVLVRHGVTEFTVNSRLDGRGGADPSLNDLGRRQARAAGRAVHAYLDGRPASVVTSSLARAVETGAAVAAALGVTAEADAEWDEQNFGDWDGLSVAEITGRHPDEALLLRNDPGYARPGGETHDELVARVLPAFERALAGGGTVVVATHRKPIMVVLAHVLGIPADKVWRLATSPASLTVVEVWTDDVASVAFVNDTSHLRGLPVPTGTPAR